MKIQGIANSIYRKSGYEALASKTTEAYKAVYRSAEKTDRVEISHRVYETDANDEKLTATSGKDTLGITKGSKDGSFIIHFSDSAAVNRAVSRGYITVNGNRIELTEDVKKQLIETDKQAKAEREHAFGKYIMQHNLAVSQQQSEVYGKLTNDMSDALEIAAKLSKGGKVSPLEEKKLLEFNPQLYTMSKIIASLAKQQQRQDDKVAKSPESNNGASQAVESAGTSSIEWKSYETTLAVSMSDAVQFQGVAINEIDMKA